ncbi:ACP S-malonyltransferase [Thalassobacillus sp. C254]|uniref:ACP S-malonyltransferase n=1 Tax=Thalassobacillus sp. C254 TaxID=1225341 RepID=UPI0006D04AB1|nr:acyltransferase domain-containing protein [Thalassobacillus sp. C254]
MSIVFLFPGQGSQKPYMLQSLPKEPEVKRTIEEASNAINEDITLRDSPDALASTTSVQLSILVASMALYRLLTKEIALPEMGAGHSVGAFTAAAAAEALSFPDAVKLVKKRGEYMEASLQSNEYGMGVITGLPKGQIEQIIKAIYSDSYPVYVTNENAPDQFAISGHKKAIKQVVAEAGRRGARKADALQVSVPSHCPLLTEVSRKMEKALEGVKFSPPKFPLAGNSSARLLTAGPKLKKDLSLSISQPVKWHESTEIIFEKGGRLFVECSASTILKDLAERAFPSARAVSAMQSGIRSTRLLMERNRTAGV